MLWRGTGSEDDQQKRLRRVCFARESVSNVLCDQAGQRVLIKRLLEVLVPVQAIDHNHDHDHDQ